MVTSLTRDAEVKFVRLERSSNTRQLILKKHSLLVDAFFVLKNGCVSGCYYFLCRTSCIPSSMFTSLMSNRFPTMSKDF